MRFAAAFAAALAAPAALHAQPAAQEGAGPALHRAPLIGLTSPDLSEAGASRPSAAVYRRTDFLASAATDGGAPKTVIDYSLSPGKLVGSLGYVCVTDGHPLDGREASVDKTSRFGRQDELVGAALNYAFW
jgi:hypothetical protein